MFGCLPAAGQVVALENIRANSVVAGLPHPLQIVAEGVPCADLTITVDQGTIQVLHPCQYEFQGTTVGNATIQIYKGATLIAEKIIRVRRWPDPVIRLGGRTHGPMGVAELKAQLGLIAAIENMDIDARALVLDYDVRIVRNQEVVFTYKNQGGRFESQARQGLQQIKRGDQLMLTNIKVLMPGEQVSRNMGTLIFKAE